MGQGPPGGAFYKAGNVGVAGVDTERPSSDELTMGSSSGLPVSPITTNIDDEMGGATDDSRAGDREAMPQGAQAPVDGVPGAARGSGDSIPRRRGRENPGQDVGRALADEAPREEALPAKGVRGPVAPSRAEREEHDRTHIPYRDWCECCVRGRGQEDAHKQSSNTGD